MKLILIFLIPFMTFFDCTVYIKENPLTFDSKSVYPNSFFMGLKDGRGPVKSTNNTSTVNLPAHSTTHINNLTNTATTTSYYNSVTLDFGGEIGAEGTREISKMISNELKKQELLINNTNIMTNFRPKI